MIALSACELNLGDSPLQNDIVNIDSTSGSFETKTDDYGDFLTGSGAALYKSSLADESSMATIHIRFALPHTDSSLTLHSHTTSALTKSYALRFTRLGKSLRLISELNGDEAHSVGILESGITNWDSPRTYTITIDNRGATPQMKIWTLDGTEPVLEETRTEGFPQGRLVGFDALDAKIYHLRVESEE